jgi:hypothetical protein
MKALLPFIHIKSAKFPALPGEDAELVNEGTYGKALAQYLETRLRERGYDVSFLCCEDWGWWMEIKGFPFVAGVCIYATVNLPESEELCVAVSPATGKRWSWSRFKSVDATATVTKLFSDLSDIFASDPEVKVLGFPEEFPLD